MRARTRCGGADAGQGNVWHPREWDGDAGAELQRRVDECNVGGPGFGRSACKYLAARTNAFIGADTRAVESVPGGTASEPFECRMQPQTRDGIWFLENMDLTTLVEEKVYEFLFAWSPLKIKGATGSPGNPVAIY